MDLLGLVRQAQLEELPGLVGRLREAELVAELRLRNELPSNGQGTAPPANPITPERAAAIAQVSVKTIYDWARGRRWAQRPSKRTLRIDEATFREWLASRARQ